MLLISWSLAKMFTPPQFKQAHFSAHAHADGSGIVYFGPSPFGTAYHYKLTRDDNKLQIWLENPTTKKQWQTAKMALEEIVQKGSMIPLATLDDYAKCFLRCLTSSFRSDEFTRELTEVEPDAVELRLAIKLQTSIGSWKPSFTFLLEPVGLPATRLCALEEEVKTLRSENAAIKEQVHSLVDELETAKAACEVEIQGLGDAIRRLSSQTLARDCPPGDACGRLTKTTKRNEVLVWERVDLGLTQGSSEIQFKDDGSIRFAEAARFDVIAQLKQCGSEAVEVEFLLNDVIVCVYNCGEVQTASQRTRVHHVVTVRAGDKLNVVYRGSGNVGRPSWISINLLR